MGYQTALGIAETNISLDQQVSWHFSSNCYPPVPQQMVPVAVQAINAVLSYEGGEDINLPEGVSFRGKTSVNAYTVVENLHLWAFVNERLEGEDE
jgi:hypothetical protein